MKKDPPMPPQAVPQTDATYERTRSQTAGAPDRPTTKSEDVRKTPLPTGGSVEGNMKTEEPDGWDQAPLEAQKPRNKRHSRPDGVGGSDPDSAVDRTDGASKRTTNPDGTVNTGF